MTPLEAMKQALDALEYYAKYIPLYGPGSQAIIDLRAAISSMEKAEPVAECKDDKEGGVYYVTLVNEAPIGKLYTHPAPILEGCCAMLATAPKLGETK